MPILEEIDENKRKKIDEFFKKSKYSNLHQSFEWAELKSDKWAKEVVYIEDSNKITAAMVVLIRKIGLHSMMYSPRGPICDIYNIETVNKMIEECSIIAKKYKAFVLKIDPAVRYNEELEKLYKKNNYKIKNDVKDILELMTPIRSMVLNIENKDIKQVFSEFKSKTRYNIRLAERKGVKVRYSRNEDDLKKFYDLMIITAKRDEIAIRSYEYYKHVMKAFGKMARIYIAEYEGQPLSAAIAIMYGRQVMYIYGASSNEKRNLMPNYLMQYNMIEWAVENKCAEYDFGGIFNTTMENGLYRFKEGFCGTEGCIKYIGEIDKVYNSVYYYAYERLFPIAEHMIMIRANKK